MGLIICRWKSSRQAFTTPSRTVNKEGKRENSSHSKRVNQAAGRTLTQRIITSELHHNYLHSFIPPNNPPLSKQHRNECLNQSSFGSVNSVKQKWNSGKTSAWRVWRTTGLIPRTPNSQCSTEVGAS